MLKAFSVSLLQINRIRYPVGQRMHQIQTQVFRKEKAA